MRGVLKCHVDVTGEGNQLLHLVTGEGIYARAGQRKMGDALSIAYDRANQLASDTRFHEVLCTAIRNLPEVSIYYRAVLLV